MTDDPSHAQESPPIPRSNLALQPLEALIGEWRVELAFPGAAPIQTSMSFTWLDDGAFAFDLTYTRIR